MQSLGKLWGCGGGIAAPHPHHWDSLKFPSPLPSNQWQIDKMTPRLAAHDDGDRTGGRMAMPIADEIAEAVLAGKDHIWCVGHVLTIGGGSAELGLAHRGNGQGVAIGIAVVR